MSLPPVSTKIAAIPEFLSGGGEMGERIRQHDWSKTALGPVELWPQSLRTCVRIMLASRQPIWIGWGKQLIKLYNDPYKAIVGGKHPWALGQPASSVWKDIWKDIDPLLKKVMENDEGTYVESQLLIMERNGYPEETYYTFSYTPIPGDEGGTAGMICANTDDTEKITSERQLTTLTLLGKSLADSKSIAAVTGKTIETLKSNTQDFPFALFYTVSGNFAVLTDHTDLGESISIIPAETELDAPGYFSAMLKRALSENKVQVLENVSEKLGTMPGGHWEILPDKAIILPVVQNSIGSVNGILIIGLNPFRLLNDQYSGFFSLIADQVLRSFSNVHFIEQERKRTEALAEIDRAKTIFFSNISHEFRTPLTLLLGPIEDVLNDSNTIPDNKLRMDVAYRNALRMQKLVNTLLEFSRIEAGRVDGKFSPVDVTGLTRDLSSSFRSAVEKAGMKLHFYPGEINDTVYVDTDMWEKIVMNLLSNAFKYSRQGFIAVKLEQVNSHIELSVSDTGIGIPADQLDKIFDRFHRIENLEGRSAEGTGIGLAMVKELVKIHRGTIDVESRPGEGSLFTVSIPTGKDHLPPEKIVSAVETVYAPAYSNVFVEEAMKWVHGENAEITKSIGTVNMAEAPGNHGKGQKKRVLLADDNADMREYISKILSGQFEVVTVANGEEAFKKMLTFKPDLLLTDIMMPVLDGFGLLKKIKRNVGLQNIPVIFLSARAGEESKIEGLMAGADDYMVKPFSARELTARVDAAIRIAEMAGQHAALLEGEVAKRTQELYEMNISLQQSNEALQQFAHVASHDLKEPVRKIKIFTERLADDTGSSFSEKAKTYIQKVDAATNRMFTMIEGVLNYSKINSTPETKQEIDLNEVIKNIESDLEILLQQKAGTVQYGKLPTIEGAPVQIYQLFYNLINNSLKFSFPGRAPLISLASSAFEENGDPWVLIRVEDNGIGFDQEHAEDIFQTFTRLHPKDIYDGTGLGLSLCKRIVERHHGKIAATGKIDEGASFIIELPVRQ